MVSPTICNLKVTKMLVDGGADLNLISPNMVKRLQILDEDLEETGTFQGINLGRSQPKGKVTLPVTFGGDLNYRIERIVFDVAEIPLPYNRILGRPTLAKFMAASHYAYNKLKMPGPRIIITVSCDRKDALIYADQLYQEEVAASATKAPAPATEKRINKASTAGRTPGSDKGSCTLSSKRASSECYVSAGDVQESSTGKSKKSKAVPLETKKVFVKEDVTGGAFVISSNLDSK